MQVSAMMPWAPGALDLAFALVDGDEVLITGPKSIRKRLWTDVMASVHDKDLKGSGRERDQV